MWVRNRLRAAKKVALVAYLDWLLSPRLLLLLIIVTFLMDNTVASMASLSAETGYLLNVLEPFVVICNDTMTVLILSLGFVCLMSGFPLTDNSSQNIIYRATRKVWFSGQLIFSLLASVTYIGLIFALSILLSMKQGFFANEWSNYTTLMPGINPSASVIYAHQLVSASVYSQTSVFGAAAYGFFSNIASFLILSLIMLVFSLYGKKVLSIAASFATVFIGMAFFLMSTPLQWLFPMSNSVYEAHKDRIFSRVIMPAWYSWVYYTVVISVLICVSLYAMKRYSFHGNTE